MRRSNKIIKALGKEPKSIVILRALQLGDLLCAIPAIKALKYNFKGTKLTLIGLPWSKELVWRFSEYLDDFIEFPGFPGLPEREVEPKKVIEFLTEVQKRKFDVAIQMQGNGTITNSLVALFGARVCGGFGKNGDWTPNKELFLKYPSRSKEVRRFLELVKFWGLKTWGEELELPIKPEEQLLAEVMMRANGLREGRYVVINGGARDPRRRWEIKKFAQVAEKVANLGYKIVLTGKNNEKELVDQLEATIKTETVNLVGQTNLGELAAIVKKSRLVITNDTGVSHIAAAVKAASVVVFSPYSYYGRWAPTNSRLHKLIRPNRATVDQVLAAVNDQIRNVAPLRVEEVEA